MLDIQFISDNAQKLKQATKNKGLNPDIIDKVLDVDKTRKELILQVESLRAEKNKLTKEDRDKGRKIKEELKDIQPQLRKVEADFKALMLQVPNMPDKDVPVGKDESANKLVRTWGKKTKFDFKPKDHIHLGQSLDLIDFKRGVKVAGFRSYFLKNQAVLLQFALMQYALKKLIDKGFTPFIPPMIVNQRALINTGHFPWGKDDIYKTHNDKQEKDVRYLAGTAEVPLVSYHQDEILNAKDLPLLYAGFSPCYRREVGSYGKDTKGLYRLHEFFKIEQVVICKNNLKEGKQWLEKLTLFAEEILQDLNLAYRVMLMSTADMGEPQVKKYDIETWMPSRNAYGETHSDSFMADFQARRANIKYRTKENKVEYAYTINNTAIASPRILIAILENYQQKDGSIKIPAVLQPYINQKTIKPHDKKA